MSILFNTIMVLTTAFFLIFTGCDNGKESKNDENSDIFDDFSDSDDSFQTEDDSDETFDKEENDDNEEMVENEETPDMYYEIDDEHYNDSDTIESMCDPNPCTAENKNVCRQIYDVFHNFDFIAKCYCNDGWIGKNCDQCLSGYFGKSCKPCECKKNEICNDGLNGDGKCSCATEIVEGKCKCNPGWSGDDCETFGENWSCTAVGQPCATSDECCYDGICLKSFTQEGSFCRKMRLFGGEEIRKMAVSPDSSFVATARMGAIRLHRADNFKELFRVADYVMSSTAIAVSPDGRFLATDEGMSRLVLRDMEDGTILDTAYHSYNQMIRFSPDGTMLATGDDDGITVYDITSNSLEPYFSHTPFQTGGGWNVESLDFSPDSRYIVAGSGLSTFDQNAVIYDLQEKKVLKMLPVDEYYLETVFSKDGTMIATGGQPMEYYENINIFKYTSDEWKFSYSLQGPSDEIDSLSFNKSSDFLAVGGRQYSFIYPLYDRFYPILISGWLLEFAPDDSSLIIGKESGELQKIYLPSFGDYISSSYNGNRQTQLSSDGSQAVFLKKSDTIAFVETLTDKTIREAILPFYSYSGRFHFSSDLKLGAFSLEYSIDGGFILYNFEDDMTILEKVSGEYYSFYFSPDEKILAAWTNYGSTDISFYSTQTGDLIHNMSLENDESISAVTFSPDGKIAALSFESENIFYNTSDWLELFTLPAGSLSFFPDGSKIIIANGSIALYSSTDGSEITEPQFNINAETAIISSDEKYLITESAIHEISTGEFITFIRHYYDIRSTGISSDNSILTTAGRDTVRAINAENILEKFAGECSEDSDCETGFFCSKKVRRCFENTEYEP